MYIYNNYIVNAKNIPLYLFLVSSFLLDKKIIHKLCHVILVLAVVKIVRKHFLKKLSKCFLNRIYICSAWERLSTIASMNVHLCLCLRQILTSLWLSFGCWQHLVNPKGICSFFDAFIFHLFNVRQGVHSTAEVCLPCFGVRPVHPWLVFA